MENHKPREITEVSSPIAVIDAVTTVRLSSLASRQTAAAGHFPFSFFHFLFL
jgi:hypothetical protein